MIIAAMFVMILIHVTVITHTAMCRLIKKSLIDHVLVSHDLKDDMQ